MSRYKFPSFWSAEKAAAFGAHIVVEGMLELAQSEDDHFFSAADVFGVISTKQATRSSPTVLIGWSLMNIMELMSSKAFELALKSVAKYIGKDVDVEPSSIQGKNIPEGATTTASFTRKNFRLARPFGPIGDTQGCVDVFVDKFMKVYGANHYSQFNVGAAPDRQLRSTVTPQPLAPPPSRVERFELENTSLIARIQVLTKEINSLNTELAKWRSSEGYNGITHPTTSDIMETEPEQCVECAALQSQLEAQKTKIRRLENSEKDARTASGHDVIHEPPKESSDGLCSPENPQKLGKVLQKLVEMGPFWRPSKEG